MGYNHGVKSFWALCLLSRATLCLAENSPILSGSPGAPPVYSEEVKSHWAFRTPVRPAEPSVGERKWVRNSIDTFVLERLEKRGLAPSSEADRATMIRRLSFDLIGLPPSPAEVSEFLSDAHPDAYERLVERLLASPHYGERWGRYWLDVAGYADSNGYFDADSDRPLAWKYRDYVIRSFNDDKPFDRFVSEQLAGDELAGYGPDQDITPANVDLLTATHFLRNAPDGTGESDGNAAELRADRYAVLEGNVQIMGSALLGLTVQCARCHDHKFEPITQDDYYGLQAVLKPIYDHNRWRKPNERAVSIGTRAEREGRKLEIARFEREFKAVKESLEGLVSPYRKLIQEEILEKLAEPLRAQVRKALETKEKSRSDEMKALLKTNDLVVKIKDDQLSRRFPELASATESLKRALEKKEKERPPPLPELAIATDLSTNPASHPVLIRGGYGAPGREAPPAGPAIFGPSSQLASVSSEAGSMRKTSGRRLALAQWVTSPNHPTFARLAVNRIWQQHFGNGLVSSPDNFGLTGARPTHPELLDWLATEFIRSGWKTKSFHRLIVNSATYRQSSALRETGLKADPDNHSLWRFPLRRLDAEGLRDAMLAISGELDRQMGGPYVPTDKTEEGQYGPNDKKPGAKRRSLYLQQRRSRPDTFLDLFDGAKLNPNCVQRTSSTMSLQSLALLNSDFARARSRAFARRLAAEGGSERAARVALAFQIALARPPTPAEREAAEKFLSTQEAHYKGSESLDQQVWTDFGQMLLAGNAFLYLE